MVRFGEPGNKKPHIHSWVRGLRYFVWFYLSRRTPSARTSGNKKYYYERKYEGCQRQQARHGNGIDREGPDVQCLAAGGMR